MEMGNPFPILAVGHELRCRHPVIGAADGIEQRFLVIGVNRRLFRAGASRVMCTSANCRQRLKYLASPNWRLV